MLKLSTRFSRLHLLISIVAVLLQVLAIEGLKTSTAGQSKEPKQQQQHAFSSEPKGQLQAGGQAERNGHTRRKDDPNRKFQARMMSEADQRATQQQQEQQQQPASSRRQDVGSGSEPDSWQQAHSLVPTFLDQGQGDEMVALASEQHEHQDAIRLPRANKSMSIGRDRLLTGQRAAEPAAEQPVQAAADKMTMEAANKARLNMQDEYEGDEEDDSDVPDEPGRLSSMAAAEYEQTLGRDPKEVQTKKLRPPQAQGGIEYTDYMPQQQFEQDSSKARLQDQLALGGVAAVANRSAVNPVRAPVESGWMPTAPTSSERQQQQQQQQQSVANKSPEPAQRDRPSSSVGERLAGFFGGREGLNKADVAIEYLRTILKNKQSQLNNSTAYGYSPEQSDNSRGQNLDARAERGLSYDRISMLTSRLNKILNTTASQANSTGEPTGADPSNKLAPSQLPSADLTNGKVRQTGSKFSISDAKSSVQLTAAADHLALNEQQPPPPHQLQQQVHSLPTTKQPPGESVYSSGLFQTQISGQPMRSNSNVSPSQIYSDQIAALSTVPVNGTPLGGDYIESLDEFPRFPQEQQHQQPKERHSKQRLHESQSQLVPIRQEAPKLADQSPENLRAQNYAAAVDQQAAQLSAQPVPLGLESALSHMQPMASESGLPESLFNLQQQHSNGPRSSRFFRMHQSQLYEDHRQPPATIPKQSPKPELDERLPVRAETRPHSGAYNSQAAGSAFQQDFVNRTQPAATYQRAKNGISKEKMPAPFKQDYPESETLDQTPSRQEQNYRPPAPSSSAQPSSAQPSISSSKIYGNIHHEQARSAPPVQIANLSMTPQTEVQPAPVHQQPPPVEKSQSEPAIIQQAQQQQQPHQSATKARPPKIVSYNYFESPNEGKESELMATNYQLADALYSSTGELGQMLSNTELEAIQNQFLTAEHPIVPIPANDHLAQRPFNHQQKQPQHIDQSLAGLLANLKPEDYPPPEALQKLMSPSQHAEENLEELASNDQPAGLAPPASFHQQQIRPNPQQMNQDEGETRKPVNKPLDSEGKKRKSLIVYLNHPRPNDMSKATSSNEAGYNLAQSVGDQPMESFISAKEFDTQGLSKDTKHLDVSSLSGFGDSKEGQDKDGLSVVVIGDAYKYKKIVLLISSKSGGLKFIPMVRDMKK